MPNIVAIEDEVELLDRLVLASEDWAKIYTKNPDNHAKLIKSEAKLLRKLRAYFRGLAETRINNYINWAKYSQDVIQAYNFTVTVDVEEIDSEEQDELLQVIHDPLQITMALGALSAEEASNIDLGLTESSEAIMRATTDYVGELVTQITDVTKGRIQTAISQSIRLHETQAEAYDRLNKILGDPRRAELIGRTETVRAYNKGISIFGKESGATQKAWEISSAPCEICAQNDGAIVGIDEDFPSGDSEPPAHPNCRCGQSLIRDFGNGDEADDGE